jgi:capsid portal protein
MRIFLKDIDVIKSNKYIKNKDFTQWVMNHTVYNSMLLEDARIEKPDLEDHIEEVVGKLFDENGKQRKQPYSAE